MDAALVIEGFDAAGVRCPQHRRAPRRGSSLLSASLAQCGAFSPPTDSLHSSDAESLVADDVEASSCSPSSGSSSSSSGRALQGAGLQRAGSEPLPIVVSK